MARPRRVAAPRTSAAPTPPPRCTMAGGPAPAAPPPPPPPRGNGAGRGAPPPRPLRAAPGRDRRLYEGRRDPARRLGVTLGVQRDDPAKGRLRIALECGLVRLRE